MTLEEVAEELRKLRDEVDQLRTNESVMWRWLMGEICLQLQAQAPKLADINEAMVEVISRLEDDHLGLPLSVIVHRYLKEKRRAERT